MTSSYDKPRMTTEETQVNSYIMSIEIEKVNIVAAKKGDHIFEGSLQNGSKPPAARDKMQNFIGQFWERTI